MDYSHNFDRSLGYGIGICTYSPWAPTPTQRISVFRPPIIAILTNGHCKSNGPSSAMLASTNVKYRRSRCAAIRSTWTLWVSSNQKLCQAMCTLHTHTHTPIRIYSYIHNGKRLCIRAADVAIAAGLLHISTLVTSPSVYVIFRHVKQNEEKRKTNDTMGIRIFSYLHIHAICKSVNYAHLAISLQKYTKNNKNK